MNSSKYNVLIYPTAESDLLDIKEYFVHVLKTSPNTLFQKFYDKVDLLEANPYTFSLVKDSYLNQIGYRMIPIDNFLLFYLIVEKEVQIHRFIYGKRNYLQIL
jgi:toxin ParE1/3/4